MEQELLCVPITPAKSVAVGGSLNPKSRVFGDWENAFEGAIDSKECGGGSGINIGENSRNCGAGYSVSESEEMSFVKLLSFVMTGAAAGSAPEKNSDHNGVKVPPTPAENIKVPPTPAEKEQISRKKPQQKVKRKKHRPKIFDASKPRRTPKPKPNLNKGSENRKFTRKSNRGSPGSTISSIHEPSPLNPQTPEPLVDTKKRKRPLKSCKRGINFNLENSVEEDNVVVETVTNNDLYENKIDIVGSFESSLGGKELMGVPNQNACKSCSLKVLDTKSGAQSYMRRFLPNDLIKNSRKSGPNCPSIFKRKRSKRRRRIWFSKYGLRSNSKQHSTLNYSVLPTESQIKAVIADTECFKCSSSFCPIVKSRRKRTKRSARSYTSHSLVTHSTPSRDTKFPGLALVSLLPLIPKGKRSERLMRWRGSNTITGHRQNNLTSESETLNIRSHKTGTFKSEACAEILTYPPQCYNNLFDVEIHPHRDDNFLLTPMTKHSKPLDIERHLKGTFIRTTEVAAGSHAKVRLRIHPPHLQWALQEYRSPNAPSTLGSSKSKVGTCHLQDNEYHLIEPYVPATKSTRVKTKLKIHPPRLELALQQYLLPTAQSTSGSPSKFTIETRHLQHESSQAEYPKYLISIIQQLEKLQINEEQGQIVVRDKNLPGALIPYKDKFDPLKRRKLPKVDLDPETIRMWNLLMENDGSELPEDEDEKTKPNWEEQRELFRKRVEVFITCMHVLQGDRRFLPWKGSVVDSVVGVFLTQNVSDYLSSNAFMSLAAKFPAPSKCSDIQGYTPRSQDSTSKSDIQRDSPCSQESTSNPAVFSSQQSHETFISPKEKEQSSPEDSVLENLPLNHDVMSCSSPRKHPTVTHGETLEFEQTGNAEQICLPLSLEVNLGSCESTSGTRSCNCGSGEIDLNRAHVCPNLSPPYNGCGCTFTVDDNMGFECVFGEEKNKNSANSNTLEVAMEDNTVSLNNNTHLVENGSISPSSPRISKKKGKATKMPQPDVDWEQLRKTYFNPDRAPGRNLDSIDWDAVRRAPVGVIAKVIETRGMNNVLAAKIKAFLDRLVEDHGSVDLEWLKDVPPDKAKEFLLSIRGVGLKSAECVRLLTLGHHAFPVDTNIARIAVRLGWVPLEPLPGDLQIHLLEQYPQMDAIQKYLWPRLCTLDKKILYVLHYQLITFGKVICTKKNPNCNSCPLRAECRHFASAFASSRLRIRGAPERSVVIPQDQVRDNGNSNSDVRQTTLPHIVRDIEDFPYGLEVNKCYTQPCEPAIELPASPKAEPVGEHEKDIEVCLPFELDHEDEKSYTQTCEPIIEVPASPEPENTIPLERDTDDFLFETEDVDEIPHFRLDTEEFKRNLMNFLNPEAEDEEVSNALVALTPNSTTIPAAKIKSVERLRTKHQVYIVPDLHPLLAGFELREHDDPCPYLLAIWPKESLNQSRKETCSQESVLCNEDIDSPGNAFQETNDQIVYGTILIPCRTANKGSFPLNGTYFQVNEVFADHESSECPILVPRKWIWSLSRRNLYCGSTASAIARGMEMLEIQQCFWNGFVCVRAFDRRTRSPEHLGKRFHELPSSVGKKKGVDDD